MNTKDYDGDALNFTILNDNLITEEYEVYSPHYTIPSINSPFNISGSLTLQGPADSVMVEYLKDKESKGDDKEFWDEYLKV